MRKKKNSNLIVAATLISCMPSLVANASVLDVQTNGQTISGEIKGGTDDYGGAGVFNRAHDVVVDGATFRDNKSLNTDEKAGYGGGLANGAKNVDTGEDIPSSIKVIKNSSFIGNQAYSHGGAISNLHVIKEGIINTLFENNQATATNGQGGAIESKGEINGEGIAHSTFKNNSTGNEGYGGAIMNHGIISQIKNSNFTGNSSRSGGAFFTGNKINKITDSTFSSNTAQYGGALEVSASANNGTIISKGYIETISNTVFENNIVTSNSEESYGGAIYVDDESTIKNIDNSYFYNNSSKDYAGAIANYSTINEITNSTFGGTKTDEEGNIINLGNNALEGGAIINGYDGIIDKISDTTFENNSSKMGGAISNYGTLKNIVNTTFKNNRVASETADDVVVGGAIFEASNKRNRIENSTFTGNYAKADYAVGGAIYNTNDYLVIENSIIDNNYIETTSTAINVDDRVLGSAIATANDLYIIDTDITNNTAKIKDFSTETDANSGSAIFVYQNATVDVSALNKNVKFENNTITDGTTTRKSDIFLSGDDADLNLNASENMKISINSGIHTYQNSNTTIDINNDTNNSELNFNGTVEFNEKVRANTINLYKGTLKTGAHSDGASTIQVNNLNIKGAGTIDLSNDYIEKVRLSSLDFQDDADVILDADLGLNAIDSFKTNNLKISDGKTIDIKSIKILKDTTDTNDINLTFVEGDDISSNINVVDYIYTSKNAYATDKNNLNGNTNILLDRTGEGGLVAATAMAPASSGASISYTVTENEVLSADLSPFNSNITEFIIAGNNKEITSENHKGFEISSGQNLAINDVAKFSGFKAENGAVIYNKGGNVDIAKAAFDNNIATKDGGVIHTTGGTINLTDVSFKNNSASGKGSIIYASGGTVNINANESDVLVSNREPVVPPVVDPENPTPINDDTNNTTPPTEPTGPVEPEGNVIYLDTQEGGAIPVLNLNSAGNRKITLSGISGSQLGYTININQNAENGGVVEFQEKVENATADGGINLYGGTLKVKKDNLIDNNVLSMHSGTLDMMNNSASLMSLQGLNLNGTTNLAVDVDLFNENMDRIKAGTYNFSDGAKINVSNMNILSDSKFYKTSILFTGDRFGNKELSDKVTNTVTTVNSALYKYNVDGKLTDNGYIFNFSRPGNMAPNNPDAYIGPVGTLLGGYANQLNIYQTAFGTMDILAGMTPAQRKAIKETNKIAFNDDNSNMTFSPTNSPVGNDVGIWFKPFTSIEEVDIKNGYEVDNFMYGGLIGADTGLIDMKYGWEGIGNAFIGYTGSRQSFNGIKSFQNGGTFGASGMLFKNNFFAGLTGSFSYSNVDADSSVGDEDFGLLSTGVAGKLGYNWAFADGKFVIQPNVTTSYTFADAENYTNAYNVYVRSDGLNAFQVAPGLKLIGNLKNNWQIFAGANYMFNIMGKTDFSVADVGINDLSIKPYVEYGAGVQKKVGEVFTGYAQVMARGGGRTGIGFALGGRWELGENPSKQVNKKATPYFVNNVMPVEEKSVVDTTIKKEKKQKKQKLKNTKPVNNFAKPTNPKVNPYSNSEGFYKPINPKVNPYSDSEGFYKPTNPKVNPYSNSEGFYKPINSKTNTSIEKPTSRIIPQKVNSSSLYKPTNATSKTNIIYP